MYNVIAYIERTRKAVTNITKAIRDRSYEFSRQQMLKNSSPHRSSVGNRFGLPAKW